MKDESYIETTFLQDYSLFFIDQPFEEPVNYFVILYFTSYFDWTCF